MGDLIDRSKLIETLEVSAFDVHTIACVEDAPTVDAKPVVHASWIDTQPDYHNGYYRNAHKCSNCGDYYTTEYDDLFFCPRCGADMRGEKND